MSEDIRRPRSTFHLSSLLRHPWAKAAGIVLLTAAVYLPVWYAGYIWDDDTALTENPAVRSPSGLWDIWFSTRQFDYFPLTFTSFWLEWRLWGAHPTGYHVVNVVLHALGAILFWRVLLRLAIPGAWLAAMVFAVHPVGVASVAWVAERKNTLSLVFFLLSLLWYLRAEDGGRKTEGGRHRSEGGGQKSDLGARFSTLDPRLSGYYWLSLLTFLLALLAKTSVVTLPFVLWLCVWWRRTGESPESKGDNRPPNSTLDTGHRTRDSKPSRFDFRVLLRLAPFFALALALGLVTVWFQSNRAMSGDLYQRDGLLVRLIGGSWAVWFYLWKSVWPLNLSMIYPRWEINPASWTAYLPALLWMAGGLVCWRFRHGWGRPVLFGLGCFLALLLPVLGFFDMSFYVYSRVADHLQYLALLGVIPLVVGGAAWQTGRWAVGKGGKAAEEQRDGEQRAPFPRFSVSPFPARLAGGIAVGLLSLLAWQRAGVFNGQETLWRDTLKKNPNAWAAYNNYAMAISEKNPQEEWNCYVTALRLNPKYPDAYNNLGVLLYQKGKIEDAVAHFREALRLAPANAFARNNLGGALYNLGRAEEALVHLQEAVRLKPDYVEAHVNLGIALMRLGRWPEAVGRLETALGLNPGHFNARLQLGNALHAQGRWAEAAACFQTALRVNPKAFEAHHNLGLALAALDRPTEALAAFNNALTLKPDSAPTQYQIGELILKQGRPAEALNWFAAAVRSQPASAEAHHRLGVTLMQTQRPAETLEHLREAIRLKPELADAPRDLAWFLATQPDAQFRDGQEAVRLASQANQLTGGTNVLALDTLAAAQAEAGQFAEAKQTAQRALALAQASGQTNLAAQIATRLRRYDSGEPFRGNQTP